jgi:transketolase
VKLRPFWSGFLIFSDYACGADPPLRAHGDPVVHVLTHDSIGAGEDGPTHQPVEQLASPRAMPGLLVLRPADANDVAETWRVVLAAEEVGPRVVSTPCCELPDRRPQEYRDSVLPPAVRTRVAIEQASALGPHRYVGDGGAMVDMQTFGASAPFKQLLERFGFTPDAVADVARRVLA